MAKLDLKAALASFDGKDISDIEQLQAVLGIALQKGRGENKPSPYDVQHLWSDNRRDASGKLVPRSCLVSGVRADHTNEAHGRMATSDEEAAYGIVGAKVIAPDAPKEEA